MIKLSFYICVLLFFAGIVSCKKDFLDVDDNSFVNRQSYVKDLTTMEHFLNGIYILLSNRQYENGISSVYPELVADNIKPHLASGGSLLFHYSWSQKASDTMESHASENSISMNASWMAGYLIIRACNFVIEDISKYHSENPAKADDIKGQAHAIRALVHFRLVNIFAQTYTFSSDGSHPGIPYITTSDITAPYQRQSVREVYEAMIKDLEGAFQLLPNATTDCRRLNKPAIKALLARLALFKGDFKKAKELSGEIASQFPLMTIAQGYPDDMFRYKASTSTETLFQLAPINHGGGYPYVSKFTGMYLRGNTQLYVATNDIVSFLKENPDDIRNKWVAQDPSGNWNIVKFPIAAAPEEKPAIEIPETAYYPAVIRTSEMYLTAAEAAAMLHDEGAARTYLDAIRKRSDPAIPSLTATGPALLDSIYKERRKELAFEELRMYDLQRWHQNVTRTDVLPNYPFAKTLAFPNDKAISPIPVKDVRLAGISPNPGY